MATSRAGSKLISPLHLILRGGAVCDGSPMVANIVSQTRLRKAAAAFGNSSTNIVLSQDQSSHSFGVGTGAARLDAAAVDWDNKLLSWRFGAGGSGRKADGGLLLARGRKPVSDDDEDDDDYSDVDSDDTIDNLDVDDSDDDNLDYDDDIAAAVKGNKGKKW